MNTLRFKIVCTYLVIFLMLGCKDVSEPKKKLKDDINWQPGYLDIHLIHTGRGNASFMVFPDGTTLLYDAGDAKQRIKFPYYEPFKNSGLTAGKRIVRYIEQVSPKKELDFALISHFHTDHYGEVYEGRETSTKGNYLLTGITEVGNLIPIKKLIDRGYPDYSYPVNRRFKPGAKNKQIPKEIDSTFINYLDFLEYQTEKNGLIVEKFQVGSNKQIELTKEPSKYPTFEVRNIKSNNRIWTEEGNEVREIPFNPPFVNNYGYYNENPLSLTLKISYGEFDYYVGGDTSGTDDYPDYNIEEELKNIIGEVDAMTLDHHGHKDASNFEFLKVLHPQIIAHQGIHDPHFANNVQLNLEKIKADVFTLSISDSLKRNYDGQHNSAYKSTKGHFFIRVYEKGKYFKVFVLDPMDNTQIHKIFGPYKSRKI